jgi:hypothetical protein
MTNWFGDVMVYVIIISVVIVGMVLVALFFMHEANRRGAVAENMNEIAAGLKRNGASIEQTRIVLDTIMGLPRSILINPDNRNVVRVHYMSRYGGVMFDLKLLYKNDKCYNYVLMRHGN